MASNSLNITQYLYVHVCVTTICPFSFLVPPHADQGKALFIEGIASAIHVRKKQSPSNNIVLREHCFCNMLFARCTHAVQRKIVSVKHCLESIRVFMFKGFVCNTVSITFLCTTFSIKQVFWLNELFNNMFTVARYPLLIYNGSTSSNHSST